MSSCYEQFRHSIVTRFMEADVPAGLLNRLMMEIDLVAQDFTIEKACTDLIIYDGSLPEVVKSYIAALAVKNCAKGTLRDYTMGLQHMFDTIRKPFTLITTNDIRLYLYQTAQQRGWKPETTEHRRTIINSFFGWCVDEELLTRNPARPIPVIKTPKKKLPSLKQIDLERLREACETPWEKCLVDVLYASGVRISEAADILLDDINWNEHSLHIRHGKGNKERYTYFNAEAEVSIQAYLDTRPGNDPHLFCINRAPYTGASKEVLEAGIRRIRNRIPDALSIKPTPHTFRRTTATTAAERGMPVEEIQAILGHENLNTTMRYITTSDTKVKHDYSRIMAG